MALLPAVTPAHGVGSRSDLPLPFTALVIAAVAALVISFVAIGTLWREPRLRDTDGVLLPRPLAALLDSRWLRTIARVLAGVLTVWTLVALAPVVPGPLRVPGTQLTRLDRMSFSTDYPRVARYSAAAASDKK